jgi:hypothetical protein
MAEKELTIKVGANISDFEKKMARVAGKMKDLGNKMQSLGKTMSTYITLPVIAAGGAAIKFATDYEESLNKVDVAFKSSSKQVQEFAKTSLKSFGIAEGTALDMAALFGDMATSMGLNTKEAADMSTALVGLAGDLASFKNIGIGQATTALNAIFTGETESLKMLGIVMTEANLEAYALSQGIRTNIKDMTQAEKVQLRYSYVMQQTTNAQGDFARTGGGAANQTRIFQESLKQLAQQFGAVILPLFTKIITKVNEWVAKFSSLSEGTKKIIIVVAGLAAAIGPLLVTLGFLVSTIIPALVAGGAMIASAWAPITLLILGVAAAYAVLNKEMKANKTEVDKLAKANTVDELKKEANEVNNLIIKLRKEREKPVRERVSPDAGDGVVYRMDNESLDELIQKELQRSINLEAAIEAKKQADIDAAKAAEEALKQQQQIESSLRAQLKTEEAHLGVVGQLQAKIAELNDQMKFQNTAEDVAKLNAEIEKTQAQLDAILNPVDSVKRKFEEIQPRLESIKAKMLELDGVIAEPIKKLGKAIYDLIPISDTVSVRFIQMFDAFGNKIRDTRKVIIDLGKELSYIATDVLISLAESMGNAFNGGTFADGLNSFLVLIADWAKQFGSLLIAAGVASMAFQKSLAANPAIAIGAGIALVAAGAAVKGALESRPTGTGQGSSYGGSGSQSGGTVEGLRDFKGFEIIVTGELVGKGSTLAAVLDSETTRRNY